MMAKKKVNTKAKAPAKAVETEEASVTQVAEGVSVPEFTLNKQTYTLQVKHFIYKGKKYYSDDAVLNHKDILKELVEANSFIFKKK